MNIFAPHLPYSKSMLIRALVIGSQLKDKIEIKGYSPSADVVTVLHAIEKLGCSYSIDNETLLLYPPETLNKKADIYIKDSAAGFRFLMALLATVPDSSYSVKLSPQLVRRPVYPLADCLNRAGADINYSSNPIIIKGTKITDGILKLTPGITSQYISALLLASPQMKGRICISNPVTAYSQQYISMTIQMLKSFGIYVQKEEDHLMVESHELENPGVYQIEPDFSCASYFWAMGSLSGIPISYNFDRSISLQPDAKFYDVLNFIQYFVKTGKIGNKNAFDMASMPDQIPTLAVLGLLTDFPVVISGIDYLKYKETDRIKVIVKEITKIGGKAIVKNNSITVYPLHNNPKETVINPHGDHRIAMAFSLLKLRYQEISISHPECVNKSFPGYWKEFNRFLELL